MTIELETFLAFLIAPLASLFVVLLIKFIKWLFSPKRL